MECLAVTNRTRREGLGDRVSLASNPWTRLRGMLGRPEPRDGEGLLIEPSRGVHMYGMKYPLDVVLLDRDGRVIALYPELAPGQRTSMHRKARYALELPAGRIQASGTVEGDVLEWTSRPSSTEGHGTGDPPAPHEPSREESMDSNTAGAASGDGAGLETHEATRAAPPLPGSLEETGLSKAFVTDLLLKVLYTHGAQEGATLSDRVRLPFALLDDLLIQVQQRYLVEVRGRDGHGRQSYVFDLTSEGRERARELMETNAYVGPAPVPSEIYAEWVRFQSVREDPVPRERIHRGLGHLVLDEEFVDRLGPGINSGRSVFLYGPPGNGKTEIAFAVAEMVGTSIYVPHAVLMEGQVIQVYDPHIHETPQDEESPEPSAEEMGVDPDILQDLPGHDRRFVRVRRPSVVVGGELTLEDLELRPGQQRGVLVAPPQMKANGGVFVIDDFGRQRVRPRDLLNRWMIPLDRGMDYLALPTGHKLEIPFDCLIFFATNLNPADLVEEAFLRRIRYKIPVPDPTREHFAEILRRVCRAKGVRHSEDAVGRIYDEFYSQLDIPPRSCHPGDIVAAVHERARYLGREPALEGDLLGDACRSYLMDIARLESSEPHPRKE